ncbi:MAG: 16S rRNA (guanine(527)-N(7))-methyltransferase RsmG [Bdellovibrionaceae bacterium]|jgi:16S rRNA (guanine527-N7)-methyltransferase|nr:16S rRNA (guanine(527)-N(7))-methyltransferase RsmG [Pseudobdellovibrionaceae bacterium]
MAHKNKSNWSAWKERQKTATKSSHSFDKKRHKKPEVIFSLPEAEVRLRDIFHNHQATWFTPKMISQLAKFYRLLMEAQEKINITRLVSLREVAIKHFIDCGIVSQLTQLPFPLLDIGSGPGFPGIVLKIIYPDAPMLLAEGVQKRVDFLKRVRDELELRELSIIGRYVTPEFEYPVRGVITRAVEDMRNTLSNVCHSLQTGGKAYFMKGPQADPELDLVHRAFGDAVTLEQDIAYSLPHTPHKRRLVIWKKNYPYGPIDEEQAET